MTRPQRTAAILAALLNAEPTAEQIARILAAFASAYDPEHAATLTPAQQHTVFLNATRAFVRETVAGAEITAAQTAARLSITPPDLGHD